MSGTGDLLRPNDWSEFIGQQAIKDRLDTHIDACKLHLRRLEHILLAAPAGVGKTSMAHITAKRLGLPFKVVMMPMRAQAFANVIKTFDIGVLLLDEVHNTGRAQQEDLQVLLWEDYLPTTSGRGIPSYLTIIGATTEPQRLTPALRSRFPIKPTFDPYTDEELAIIIVGMAAKCGIDMDADTAVMLGTASGGIPRSAREFVFAARDIEATTGKQPNAQEVLDFCRVGLDGLTEQHMQYLRCLDDKGGRAGLKTLSTHLRVHAGVVQELEILLGRHKYVEFTEKGRELTGRGTRRARGLSVEVVPC